MARSARIHRKTAETDIQLKLNLDGRGKSRIATGIRFFDHMLDLVARHGAFDTRARAYRVSGAIHIYTESNGKDVVRLHLRPPYLVDADRRILVWASGPLLCSAVYWIDSMATLGDYPGCTS